MLFGLALLVIGYVGTFFGNMIKAAVSRQREFLADASAVQFTRNPGGLAHALAKIQGLVAGSRVRATSEVVSVEDVGGGWWQVATKFTVEVEGSEKPACVAESVGRALI